MKNFSRQSGAFILITIVFLMAAGGAMLYAMSNLSSVSSTATTLVHNGNVAQAAAQSGLGFGIYTRMTASGGDRTYKIYCNKADISTEIAPTPCAVSYCSTPDKLNADGVFTVSGFAVCNGGTSIQSIRLLKQDMRVDLLPDGVTYQYKAIPGSRANVAYRLDPAFGPKAGGTSVTITGIGFSNIKTPLNLGYVTFDGVAVTALTYNSDTSMTVTTPAYAGTAPKRVDLAITYQKTGPSDYIITFPNAFTYQ